MGQASSEPSPEDIEAAQAGTFILLEPGQSLKNIIADNPKVIV